MKIVNCDIYEFCKITKDKNLICFGAGQVLRDFMSLYSDFAIEKNIVAIADNDKRKKGQMLSINNCDIKIISVDDIKRYEDPIVLISCADVVTIYNQLNGISELNEKMCFVANFIKSETNLTDEKKRNYPQSFRVLKKPVIPKKIHYCWFGKNPIPEQNRKWIESWKRYCPDYEIIEWNESNYDITKNQYMYEAYKAEKWGFVPDYARLDIIYEHGGIYLDTDVEIIKNMDELLCQEAFAGVDGTHFISLGLGFGAKKGNGLIKILRDEYEKVHFVDENGDLNLIAAPTLQAPFFEKVGFKKTGELQVIDGMTIYPEKVLAAKCIWTGRVMPTKETFAIHHYDASWCSSVAKSRKQKNIELFNKCIETL